MNKKDKKAITTILLALLIQATGETVRLQFFETFNLYLANIGIIIITGILTVTFYLLWKTN